MSGIMSMLLGAVSSVAVAVDEFFNRVTLLLPGNGTNGAQNNTFLDSSSNNFTITRNGNTTQGTFSPFSQTGWSAYLTSIYGSSTFTSRTLFNGNSTIELWVYPNALSGQQTIIVGGGINFGTNGAKLRIDDGVNAGSIFESTGTITANTWNYVVVVRSSNTFSFYINGNLDSSNASISSFYTSNATSLNVGAFNSIGSNAFVGYLSNIRVSNIARTISVPTVPYSSDANTVWLIFQSNRFVDNSGNAYALTFVGTPSVQAFSPFLPTVAYTPQTIGGSGYFDGTGDYLNYTGTNLNLGTGAFTLEGWAYQTVRGYISVIATWTSNAGAGFMLGIDNAGLPEFYTGNASSPANYTLVRGTTAIPLNTWVHLAATKAAGSSGTMTLYVDGVSVGTPTAGTRSLDQTSTVLGRYYTNSDSNYLTGYISSVRVSNTVRTITVPTAPYTSDANTLALFNFTNAGITDATAKNDLETVGNAQISTTQSKFGGSSMYFDGTGDYLTSNPATTDLYAFGSGDFTIEMWLRLNSVTGTQVFYDQRPIAGGVYPTLYMSNATLFYYANGANRITGSNLSTNQWYHIAVSRSGTSTRLFVDGTQSGSTYTDTNVYLNAALRPFIGGDGTNIGSNGLNGFIDDLRITKGFARYTANFTAPTTAFPLQ